MFCSVCGDDPPVESIRFSTRWLPHVAKLAHNTMMPWEFDVEDGHTATFPPRPAQPPSRGRPRPSHALQRSCQPPVVVCWPTWCLAPRGLPLVCAVQGRQPVMRQCVLASQAGLFAELATQRGCPSKSPPEDRPPHVELHPAWSRMAHRVSLACRGRACDRVHRV